MSKTKPNKAKKPVSSKAKQAPRKTKSVSNPDAEASAPMKAALAAVAAMPSEPAKESKLDIVVKLLCRPEGATIDDITASTGWQKHTVRSCISHALAKKRGYKIVSDKPQGGKRAYRIEVEK